MSSKQYVEARYNGVLLAKAEKAAQEAENTVKVVEGNYYFPPGSLIDDKVISDSATQYALLMIPTCILTISIALRVHGRGLS